MRAVLVTVRLGPSRSDQADDNEIVSLALSAGAEPVAQISCRRDHPDPALFVGSGKADEIAATCAATQADLLIFDHALSPAQQRNLERVTQKRVVDRVALILDIFALRARSHEGKVQVELAQLKHLSTRLVRGWTHLERQRGGIGLRGPGETQLETDRRLIGQRVKMLQSRLATLQKQRATQRRARQRRGAYSVSLVGYTNAGKSTLFNALTHADTYAADQLFATLDTTSRRVWLGPQATMVLSDTVGFIRDLPHELVAAFRATLTETLEADLLLHVIDAADPLRHERIGHVEAVLDEIGALDVPRLEVMNKIDASGGEPSVIRDEDGSIVRVGISAATGAGLDGLRTALIERLGPTETNHADAATSYDDADQATNV